MKRLLRVVGGILMAIGAVWVLQGLGVLPGSFMSGQRRWAVNGAVTALLGLGLWVASRRR